MNYDMIDMENETPSTTSQSFWQRTRTYFQGKYQAAKNALVAFRARYPKLALTTFILGGLASLGIVFILLLTLTVYAGGCGKLPNYAELRGIQNFTSSELYSADSVLLNTYFLENRINADFDEISPNVIDALIAAEDARYFEHKGVDLKAWMRVLFKSILLSDRASGGGSTLSQQLAKNLYPRREYWVFSTLVNKLRETFTARRLERIYTKEELLRLYLNTVSFSDNTFGIKVASKRFFNKKPSELAVEEAAVLIGMLKGPTIYNPITHPSRSFSRRNIVLKRMATYGAIPQEDLDSLQEITIKVYRSKAESLSSSADYFKEHIRPELESALAKIPKPDGSPYNLFTDGLKIYSTIDSRMQRYAEEAVAEEMAKIQAAFHKDWKKGFPLKKSNILDKAYKASSRYQKLQQQGLTEEAILNVFNTEIEIEVFSWDPEKRKQKMTPLDSIKYYLTLLNTGLLAVNPSTGFVKAWVGGIDYGHIQYDHIKAHRQVGSTIKPIVYAGALRNGMLPCEYTYNRRRTFEEYDDWSPRNSDGNYEGVYSMEGALSNSVNAVTVEVLFRAGLDSVRQLSQAMGIDSPIPQVPAISLGAVDASLWDMVQVYGTLANRGKRPEFHMIDRIETSTGEVLLEFNRPDPSEFERVLEMEHSDMMIHMMKSVVDSGTARRLRYRNGLRFEIAGKTGTTQKHSDGWFLGFTPKLVAGVWVGAESPKVHFRSMSRGQGSSTALPIWGKFMQKVYQDPAFKPWRKIKFEPPQDTALALLQCPPYLDEMPIIANYWDPMFWNGNIYEEFPELFESSRDGDFLDIPPREEFESTNDYIDRVTRQIERLREKRERRERRKEFWDRILFRRDDDDDGR